MRKERKIINTNIRLNLCDEQDRQAWEYLQTMDRQKYKSYTKAVVAALNDYFAREYRNEEDPYLESREKEDAFLEIRGSSHSVRMSLTICLLFLTGIRCRQRYTVSAIVPWIWSLRLWQNLLTERLIKKADTASYIARSPIRAFWKE